MRHFPIAGCHFVHFASTKDFGFAGHQIVSCGIVATKPGEPVGQATQFCLGFAPALPGTLRDPIAAAVAMECGHLRPHGSMPAGLLIEENRPPRTFRARSHVVSSSMIFPAPPVPVSDSCPGRKRTRTGSIPTTKRCIDHRLSGSGNAPKNSGNWPTVATTWFRAPQNNRGTQTR
jgi:hypothetical protein